MKIYKNIILNNFLIFFKEHSLFPGTLIKYNSPHGT